MWLCTSKSMQNWPVHLLLLKWPEHCTMYSHLWNQNSEIPRQEPVLWICKPLDFRKTVGECHMFFASQLHSSKCLLQNEATSSLIINPRYFKFAALQPRNWPNLRHGSLKRVVELHMTVFTWNYRTPVRGRTHTEHILHRSAIPFSSSNATPSTTMCVS